MNFQNGLRQKERAQHLNFRATIFLNNAQKHKKLYYGYRFIELTCLFIHLLTFGFLFILLDKRFLKIGYTFFTEPNEVEDIFSEHGACLASRNAGVRDDRIVAERRSCHLLQNDFNKMVMVILWCVFILVFVGHVLNLAFQTMIFLTCSEKR